MKKKHAISNRTCLPIRLETHHKIKKYIYEAYLKDGKKISMLDLFSQAVEEYLAKLKEVK